MKNIDFIYVINLDKRPERLLQSLTQLHPYGIYPYRFSAVNGYAFTVDELNEMGVKLTRSAKTKRKGIYFMVDADGIVKPYEQQMKMIGRTYFNVYQGGIGCTLSHLSILQDAYDSNYETIWILEDDFAVVEDPRVMPDLIEELDRLVGKENWDILFTDMDQRITDGRSCSCRPSAFYRPNDPYINLHVFDEQINDNFRRISARCGTHSMIVRKSGIKKILNYLTSLGLFVSYDREVNNIDNIQMYALTRDIITNNPSVRSDAETAWDLAEADNSCLKYN